MLARGSRLTKKRELCCAAANELPESASFSVPRSPRRIAANTPGNWFTSRTVHSEIVWLPCESGVQSQKAGSASDFTGRGEGFVDFPEEAPLDFRDLLHAHTEYASPLGQLFKVGLDVELRDVRREALKRQHILIS